MDAELRVALHHAVLRGHAAVAEALLAAGGPALLFARDLLGCSPVHLAAMQSQLQNQVGPRFGRARARAELPRAVGRRAEPVGALLGSVCSAVEAVHVQERRPGPLAAMQGQVLIQVRLLVLHVHHWPPDRREEQVPLRTRTHQTRSRHAAGREAARG